MVMSVDLRFPDGKAKALTLSYDDGVEYDIRLRQHRAIRNGRTRSRLSRHTSQKSLPVAALQPANFCIV